MRPPLQFRFIFMTLTLEKNLSLSNGYSQFVWFGFMAYQPLSIIHRQILFLSK